MQAAATTQSKSAPRTAIYALLIALTVLCTADAFQASSSTHQTRNVAPARDDLTKRSYTNDVNAAVPSNIAIDVRKKVQRRTKPANVFDAHTKEDCQDIAANQLDRLTVFRFHASWCRGCKYVAPKFDRLARKYPDVNFVSIELTEATKQFIMGDLGVPSLPYGAIFHPDTEGLVEKLNMNKDGFKDFERIVQSYADKKSLLAGTEDDQGCFSAAPYNRLV